MSIFLNMTLALKLFLNKLKNISEAFLNLRSIFENILFKLLINLA